MEFETVIGLEIHAELSTESKIYCGCKNGFGGEPNTRCCPVCTGMPGTLPVLNETVVAYGVKMGCALNCKINRICRQERKNYFYPDLPKAYQISQLSLPLCERGHVDIFVDGKAKRIGITRIQIEEDAGKLLHGESGSLIDFNRCGVPLLEIVSEPDLRSAQEAKAYLETIKATLQYMEISDCKMQEGSLRCDVNVSVREKGSPLLGTRCEMKNVNSFRGAARAVEYETARQIKLLEGGGTIEPETRRWDDNEGKSFLMRGKEDAEDYRYFPEPDLPAIVLDAAYVEQIRTSVPELPNQKTLRYQRDYGLSQGETELLLETVDRMELFEYTIALERCSPRGVCNWILGDIAKLSNETGCSIRELSLRPESLAELLELIESGQISNATGKRIFADMMVTGKSPRELANNEELTQVSDDVVLMAVVRDVLEANPKSEEDYRKGKKNALGYLMGQCMKATQGRGNPSKMKEFLLEILDS